MNPQDILARAQRDLDARRAAIQAARIATATRYWTGPRRWIWVLLVVLAGGAFLVIPGSLPDKLRWLMGGMCGLRPSHSYTAGHVLPLESRMVGMYGGFLITLMTLVLRRRIGARWLGTRPIRVVLALFFASMIADGINSTLMEFQQPHLYTTTNLHRLITGLLWGIATGSIIVWLLRSRGPADLATDDHVQSGRLVLLCLSLNGLFAAVVLQEQPIFYYPIALLSVGGGIAAMASLPFILMVQASALGRHLLRARLVVAPVALALLIGITVVLGFAALRWNHGMEGMGTHERTSANAQDGGQPWTPHAPAGHVINRTE